MTAYEVPLDGRLPQGYPIPSGAFGPYATRDGLGIRYDRPRDQGERVDADSDPDAYEQAVRAAVERGGRSMAQGKQVDFSVNDVVLWSSRPWTRLIVHFTHKARPGALGYWGSVWEQLAWEELNGPAHD